MKITLKLSQEEINAAISQYVATQGLSIEDKAVSIEMVNGRKGNSNYATIELIDKTSDSIGSVGIVDPVQDEEDSDADRQEAYDNNNDFPLTDEVEPAAVAEIEEEDSTESVFS